jgi:hypothetical protein
MLVRSLRIAVVGLAGLAFAMAWAPQRARAAIVERIFAQGTSDLLGIVSFPSVSGDSVAGVGLSYGLLTAADITSASWTLDPSTLAVVSLDLEAVNPSSCSADPPAICSATTLTLFADVAEPGGYSCVPGVPFCIGFFQTIPVSYVAAPEPSTWAMMFLGFAGLGYAGYRASRRAVVTRIRNESGPPRPYLGGPLFESTPPTGGRFAGRL